MPSLVGSEMCIRDRFHIGRVKNGSWIKFPNVKLAFNYQDHFSARVAAGSKGGNIEVITDSLNGEKIGVLRVGNTGGWDSWQMLDSELVSFSGTRDIFLRFTGEEEELFNIDWFRFN